MSAAVHPARPTGTSDRIDPGRSTAARRALAQRVRAVAAPLGAEIEDSDSDPSRDAAAVLSALGAALADHPSNDRVWLALAGIGAAFPTRDEVDRTRRSIELSGTDGAAVALLEHAMIAVTAAGSALAEVSVVSHGVLVDVDFTARHDLNTGIQRVVRQTVPLWAAAHDIVPVAWTSARSALRKLDAVERSRVYAWTADRRTNGGMDRPDRLSDGDLQVVLPWHSVLVLPEVPQADVTPRIAGISACSNNAVVAIGHDAIPLLSADTLDMAEPGKFMSFLSALKFADRIAGVSHSSAAEFAAFGSMLSSQGLPAPTTVAVPLPVEFAASVSAGGGGGDATARTGTGGMGTPDGTDPSPAEVVVVGSHDPRKNHLAILQAAEILWQEGLSFRLSFIGSGGSNQRFVHRVRVLEHRGRDVRLRQGLSDAQLRDAVTGARFTVFPSLHEGYGLPVAESLALGTPVITTAYGSTAEIAADGGAVTVDPRDDEALTRAMRDLLTDDTEIDRLRAEIARRPKRSWQDYADELWNALVGPVLPDPGGPDHARVHPAVG